MRASKGSMTGHRILVLGLSPAWQRTLHFDRVRLGSVNRAHQVTEIASGKGVNVARVVMQVGGAVRLLTVAGGRRGRLLAASLDAQRIPSNIVRVKTETRYCQTLLGGRTTELVEEAGALVVAEVKRVVAQFRRELLKSCLVLLSGSVPPGCGKGFYGRLIAEAGRQGVPALVDTQGEQLMDAVRERPLMVRVTRGELLAATGGRSVEAAAVKLMERGAEWVVVSDGCRGVYCFGQQTRFCVKPPAITEVSAIGSGDAMLAGIGCALARGETMPEAIRFGVACGTANALALLPGHVQRDDVEKLLRRTRWGVYKG